MRSSQGWLQCSWRRCSAQACSSTSLWCTAALPTRPLHSMSPRGTDRTPSCRPRSGRSRPRTCDTSQFRCWARSCPVGSRRRRTHHCSLAPGWPFQQCTASRSCCLLLRRSGCTCQLSSGRRKTSQVHGACAQLSTQARAPGHCSNVMLAVAAPTLAQNPPTGQSSQLVELVPELNEPGGHAVQLTLAASAVYWPGRHGRQTAPVTGSAIVPLEQSAQRGAAQVAGSVLTRSGKDES